MKEKEKLTPLEKAVKIALSQVGFKPEGKPPFSLKDGIHYALDFVEGVSIDAIKAEINRLKEIETKSREKERAQTLSIPNEPDVPDVMDHLKSTSFFDETDETIVDGEVVKKQPEPLKEDEEKSILEIEVEDEELDEEKDQDFDDDDDDLEEKTAEQEAAEEIAKKEAKELQKSIDTAFAKLD